MLYPCGWAEFSLYIGKNTLIRLVDRCVASSVRYFVTDIGTTLYACDLIVYLYINRAVTHSCADFLWHKSAPKFKSGGDSLIQVNGCPVDSCMCTQQ